MNKPQRADNQNIIEQIHRKLPYLNPALRRIGEFILAHPEQCKTFTIKQLATACEVAESTVSRFVKEMDLKGYQDLKIAIAEAVWLDEVSDGPVEEKYLYEGISRTDSIQTIFEKVLHRNIQTLNDTRQRLNMVEVGKAVNAIERANTLVLSCMGSSGVAGEEAVMRFTRAGKKCLLFRDQGIQLMTAAIVGPQDVVIGISNSGRSAPTVESLRLARSNGASTIGITSFENSPLVKYTDIPLFTPTKLPPPGLDLYGEATTSVTAQILVIDTLYACFAAKNFDQALRYLEATFEAAIKDSRVS